MTVPFLNRFSATFLTLWLGAVILSSAPIVADEPVRDDILQLEDVFELEYVRDPRISPSGQKVAYVRSSMDIMKDRRRSRIWIVDRDGRNHRPMGTGETNESAPRWSPTGDRLLYVSSHGGEDRSAQMFVRWMESGQTTSITQLTESPSGLSWSPDGRWIAFTMRVPKKPKPLVQLPSPPEGAEWAKPPKLIESVVYRRDGSGFVKSGFQHIFVVPAEGGTPRQITTGDFHHGGLPSWSADGETLYFSANRNRDWERKTNGSEIHSVSVKTREIVPLTDREGPDENPRVSPDGKHIAYLGFDDRYQGYQVTRLYVMNRDGTGSRCLTEALDRSVGQIEWRRDSAGVLFSYATEGNTKIAFVDLKGKTEKLADNLGGTSIGRPYSGGSFSVADRHLAYTHGDPHHLADVAVARFGEEPQRITDLNGDLFGHKELGAVEELWYESSHDQRRIQGWIIKPPHFDPSRKYPLILEIHGGPFANYGDRFAAELQLYAAAGYVVLYTNPRGSTSYGGEFGNLIHHNYPGEDYDDLISGVDATIAKGYVDPEQLFVTGGSGGGVLSAWIVGKTDRFKAAVVAKPVINWYSFALTADYANFFYKYWFPGYPWDHPEHYMKRSPISLVGNVTTPTMLLTGEKDYRTPIAESEQFYQALQLRGVESALVRVPGASHGIAARPSQLMAKVAYVLAWFDKYRTPEN